MEAHINRGIFILIPKKPFYNWMNSLTPNEKPVDKFDECDSYLVDDDWLLSDVENFLKNNYDEFFQEQLFGAWTDESVWPKNRSWQMFVEWFEWHFSSIVRDLCPEHGIESEEW
jgi:hypothetical protein